MEAFVAVYEIEAFVMIYEVGLSKERKALVENEERNAFMVHTNKWPLWQPSEGNASVNFEKDCPQYGAKEETLIHALKDCPIAWTILTLYGLDNRLLVGDYPHCINWIEDGKEDDARVVWERAQTLCHDFRIHNFVNNPMLPITPGGLRRVWDDSVAVLDRQRVKGIKTAVEEFQKKWKESDNLFFPSKPKPTTPTPIEKANDEGGEDIKESVDPPTREND
ncbi:hypothetical protein Gotri_011343 [Gossypium trilobum]|uniref:Reverse transcriptase zinc-binding domain-containing protein n=1 Tax=Gossypium trilobum TaxID=34281 RepID=A0A7J9EU05_9ROSI|nr:hypothetical protein [Gossypium trilobum]